MTPAAPDLHSEQGRADYRRELRRVGLPIRWGGLALIVIAALWVVAVRDGRVGLGQDSLVIAYGILALGWAMVIAAVFMRTRHHRQRMSELDGGRM